MAATNNLLITLVEQSQSQKEVTVNEAISRMDAILNIGAKDKDLATPPGSPAAGDAYIVAASPTGAWAGQAGKVTYYDQIWKFIIPKEGMTLWVNDEDKSYTYDGAAWVVSIANAVMGKKTLWIPAAAMQPAVSNGCTPLSVVATSAGQPDIAALEFDPATQQYAQFSVRMPKSWNAGTVTARFLWAHAATTTNFGVVWNLQGVAARNAVAIGQNFGTAQQVTATGGTTDNLYISSETSAITIAGTPAKEDLVFFRASRVAGDAADTMAINARLLGVALFYSVDAGNDA